MKKLLSVATLGLISSTGAVLVGVTPASAAEDCKTTVTNLSRPDHGHGTVNGGFWANLVIKRTTKFCVVPAEQGPAVKAVAPPATVHYHVVVTDEGTFTTIAGATLSPNNAMPLTGGVKGKVRGGFSQDLWAPAGWLNYQGNYDGQSFAGLDNPTTTGKWVAAVWGGEVKTEGLNNDWGWVYWTCSDSFDLRKLKDFKGEYWWDAASPASDDGQSVLAGDITGKRACPSASPSASVTPTGTPTQPNPTTTPVGTSDSLPLTGAPIATLVGSAIALMLVGGFLIRLALRRRMAKFILPE